MNLKKVLLELDLLIMTKEYNQKKNYTDDEEKIDNICEECKKEDESVKQNLIMHSYKICNSCNLSKRIFPL